MLARTFDANTNGGAEFMILDSSHIHLFAVSGIVGTIAISESRCATRNVDASPVTVMRRIVLAFLKFLSTILSAALTLALLAAPAESTQLEHADCEKGLMKGSVDMAAMHARLKSVGGAHNPATCDAARLYFLEMVKERAVTAVCKAGAERERELDRLDANVEQTNRAIASSCAD